MELTERKKKVLRSVVDLYIRTAEPVGSKAITELPDMNYSSATIRNEMADLTTMGYLEQPHTSAGRVPSAAGYRMYVDELMMDYRLSVDETKSIINWWNVWQSWYPRPPTFPPSAPPPVRAMPRCCNTICFVPAPEASFWCLPSPATKWSTS